MPALKLPPVPGDLPAIAADASIEAARCPWRWQAGGRRVAGRFRGIFEVTAQVEILFPKTIEQRTDS